MFRLWGKIIFENRLIKDTVIINEDLKENRTRKVLKGLEDICIKFDLSLPIWLDSNIAEFKRISKVRFTQDNFVDSIDFDFLEIQVIEDD